MLTFTKQIKNGVLRASQMEIGSSVQGKLKALQEGKYGTNLVLDVNGKDVLVYTSGNIKSLNNNENFVTGAVVTITRKADYQTKNGRMSTSFDASVKERASAAPAIKAADTTEEVSEVAEARARIAEKKAALKSNG